MEQNFKVEWDTLITPIFKHRFENVIGNVIFTEGLYLVQLSISNEPIMGRVLGTIFDNIYALNREGELVWRIKADTEKYPFTEGQMAFTWININKAGRFCGTTFVVGSFYIDVQTGKLLEHVGAERFDTPRELL